MKRLASSIWIVAIISLWGGSAFCADFSKEGSGEYRSARTAQVHILKLGEERMQINYDETGVVVEAPPDSPFCNASFNTMGTIHVINGDLTYNGSALWTNPDGDQIYGTFKGEGKLGGDSTGFLEIVGGSGKCAGIQGTLKLKSGPRIKSSKKGFSMGVTVGTITWKIP